MTVYWLTGVIGAGKSTLGAALASSFPETDFIDGDFCLAQDDALPFDMRIENRKNYLIKTCREYVQKNKDVVIAYPIIKETVDRLRSDLVEIDGKLIVIVIGNIPENNQTRGYSQWEKKRRNEMTDVCNPDMADILFHHPTGYLHDSLKHLLGQLQQIS